MTAGMLFLIILFVGAGIIFAGIKTGGKSKLIFILSGAILMLIGIFGCVTAWL